MRVLEFKLKHEDMIENRIETIENAIYEKDGEYIVPLFELLIRFLESLDGECLYTNQCQARLEEALMWWERIPDGEEEEEKK